MTGLQLATRAMKLVGLLDPGEPPDNNESQDMLGIINGMLDSWNAERLMIYTIARQVFNLNAGQATYTMGTGGNFNIPRPPKIERVSIITNANAGQPLELPVDYLTVQQFQDIPVKNTFGALPLQVYDDQAFPLRNLTYWPIPNVSTVQGVFYTWTALPKFPDLHTDFTFPPGYEEALKYNLAVRTAPEFGTEPSPSVIAFAVSSMAVVKAMNIPIIDLHCDPAVVNPHAQIYNWISDSWVSK